MMEWFKTIAGRDRTKTKIQRVSESNDLHKILDMHRYVVQKSSELELYEHHPNTTDSFYRAIGPVIRFVQFFNMFPAQNVLDTDVANISFHWISFLTMRSVLFIGLALLEVFLYYWESRKRLTLSFEEFTVSAVFTISIAGMINFVRIAQHWNSIMQRWLNLEQVFLLPPYKQRQYSLKLKLRLVSFVFFFLMFTEYGLYVAQRVYYHYIKVKLCHRDKDDYEQRGEQIYEYFKPHVYSIFGFNYLLAGIFELSSSTLNVSWNFVYLFVILFSIGITERFRQFIDRLETSRNKNMPASFWTECRLHYNRLEDMVNMVNQHFGVIILLVCFNNLYFMCAQIYSTVKVEFPFVIHQIYFIYSLVYTVVKFLALLLTAAQINEVSKIPQSIMRDIPVESWDSETERFFTQMKNDCVALTGYNLFYMTNKFLLGIAGTIITYEMIVMDNVSVNTQLTKADLC